MDHRLFPRSLAFVALVAAGTLMPSYRAHAQPGNPHGQGGGLGRYHRACTLLKGADTALCDALIVDVLPNGLVPNSPADHGHRHSTAPSGYGPTDLQSAYSLPTTGGSGQTVALVDAYDDPNAESDLSVYRTYYGLPSCTTANGCFKKVNQAGVQGSYPRANSGWAEEISLDLDMVSAICPNCHILLVEAKSASYADLGAAEDTAATLGATEISNSYGGSESSTETSYDAFYNHPGIAITASSGDNGYGAQYPAASPYVTAVGGTSLNRDPGTARGWSETAWSGSGSGCSAYESRPSWQTNKIDPACSNRTIADVSAVADPYTGVAVYDSFHAGGWLEFGGTSVSSPIIASVYALAGNAGKVTYGSYPYSHTGSLYDVTSGSNGSCGTYLCTAGTGYDGPTGLGTPDGGGAF
jgi:subtilase family serine protease